MNGEQGTGVDTDTDGRTSTDVDVDADGDVDVDVDDDTEADPVELGVELLRKFEGVELSVAAAVDRLETITTNPAITRTILERAELEGVVEREDGLFRSRSGEFVRFESEVTTKEGDFTCRRCGAGLETGYFLELEAGEHGPFGSSCIRKVTGRERE